MTAVRKVPMSSSPAPVSSLALSDMPLATVRIVPSLGFITALYAVSTAYQQIDAKMLSKMFLAGARNLENKKEWINELNVFPVPDGDTAVHLQQPHQTVLHIDTGHAHDSKTFHRNTSCILGDHFVALKSKKSTSM